ncbi:MAG: hypothetical protein ACPGU5_01505 [Lishizhenia sp.]
MKIVFTFFLFITAFFSVGQFFNGHFDSYVLSDYSFEQDTVIKEPYAIVHFYYDFEERNPGELMQLVVSTPQSCELYKLNPSNKTTVIVNRSELEFRVEDQHGRKWIYAPKHSVVQGRVNTIYLKRVWLDDLKDKEIEFPVLQDQLEKPVVYFYSTTKQEYTLEFPEDTKIDFTYPKLNQNRWIISANKKGVIETDETKYPYLFWETSKPVTVDWTHGFIVNKENILSFLEDKLSEMNLNYKEKTDFITYWFPKMAKYDRVDIQFLFNASYQKEILDIQVTPNVNAFRVFMFFKPSSGKTKLKPQIIEKAHRTPTFYLEWGGAEQQTIKIK